MTSVLNYAIPGLPFGCIYALVAVGLVLTYRSSGVFNLAFGAQAYISAAVFYDTAGTHHWPTWAAFAVSVLVVGPLVGLLLDRAIFRHLRTASATVKLVAALGLLVGIPALIQALWFGTGSKLRPPALGPTPEHFYKWHSYGIDSNQVAVVVATILVVVGLGFLFRSTAFGLRMRAVVESPRLLQLHGVNAERVATSAWVLSSLLAALAGVLLAPLYARVDSTNFTVLMVAAIAAAVFGGLRSLPLTLLGGILLGVAQEVLTKYLPLGNLLVKGFRPSLPFILLMALLLFRPGLRKPDAADPLAGVSPPPPPLAASLRDERLERLNRVMFPAFVVAFLVVSLFFLPSYWLFLVTQGIVMSVIFLSFTVVMGMAGQISLCQATFAGVGALTTAQLATNHGVPVLVAMVIGAVVAALVGVVVALPALRLGGLYLALATFAFALMVDNLVFPQTWAGNGQTGVNVPRPQLGPINFGADRAFFLLALGVFALCALVVVFVRRGTTGQRLAAIRGSEVAAETVGIDPRRAKIVAFALSAAIAGLGGALLGSLQGTVSGDSFSYFYSLFWLVLVVTTGVRTVEGAVNAGMALVFVPELLHHLPGRWANLEFVLFGFGAINYAKHPEGIVEFQKRRSIERMVAWRRRRERPAPEAGSDDAPDEHERAQVSA
ncbi:MAG: ABC transporter permease [Acidimicrobiia bacterium]|nr:ABC transporter permease [Acidimicrobiia bacterium]